MTSIGMQAWPVTRGITPEVLLGRLVAGYEAKDIEDLGGRTPKSLRTLRRWKSEGFPQGFSEALVLLDEAGLLRTPEQAAEEDDTSDRRLQQLAGALSSLSEAQREVLRRLDEVERRLKHAEAVRARDRVAPKRKGWTA